MRVLFDTNILVRITDVRTEMGPSYADVVRLSNKLHRSICYHPSQKADLERDKDPERRKVNLSRIEQYECLANPPQPTAEHLALYDWQQNDDNDRVDNELLYAAFQGAVRYLVTQDKKMHHKAKRAAISDLVLTIDDYLDLLRQEDEAANDKADDSSPMSNISQTLLKDIPLTDPIFDTLKESYLGFDKWFRKAASEDRHAWVARDSRSKITAICIHKEEGPEDDIGGGVHLPGRTLKLCTFKVAGRGDKLGERLLHCAFLYAANNGYDNIYMQIHSGEQHELISLIENFGFVAGNPYTSDGHTDLAFVKRMHPDDGGSPPTQPADILRFDIDYYPYFCDGTTVQKFLVPITQHYHSMLFPESVSLDMLERAGCYGHPSENNAITKAYVCNANTGQIQPGDLLLFYNSDIFAREIEVVAFVDRVFRSTNKDEVMNAIARRTVYLDADIQEKVSKRGGALVILFRILHYLKRPVKKSQLHTSGVKGNYQSIRLLADNVYQTLIHPQLKRYAYEKRDKE